jgi:hypothetical protein
MVPVPEDTSTVPEVLRLTLLLVAIPEARENVVPFDMERLPLPSPPSAPREIVPAERVVPPE